MAECMHKDMRSFAMTWMTAVIVCWSPVAPAFTVLNAKVQQNLILQSRTQLENLLTDFASQRQFSLNEQITYLTQQFADKPYIEGGIGEGDWQPKAMTYHPGAVHVMQYPVYRLDGFDCQSFVQVVMGMLHAGNLAEFDHTFLAIAYGAAGNPNGDIVRYYNRNNFVDGDFNPINHQNGFLRDATSEGLLANYVATTSSFLNRHAWFARQTRDANSNVVVLHAEDGTVMTQRFKHIYTQLKFPRFDTENVSLTYLPKEALAKRQWDGSYKPNRAVLAAIPVPSVVEIVRDPSKWYSGDRKIKQVVGTDLNISHLGFLYQQTFQYGELIYRKINCTQQVCHVTPVTCQQKQCSELMFAHATDAHPKGYFWYQQANGNYTCTAQAPRRGQRYTYCNRIERLPFFDYLTGSQHGWYMTDGSYLGVHVEKL